MSGIDSDLVRPWVGSVSYVREAFSIEDDLEWWDDAVEDDDGYINGTRSPASAMRVTFRDPS